jgi:mannosylglycoprotein endo-beta-mannosidase
LEQVFSEAELKYAIFGLPAGKAPRPNGFTAGFYRKCWSVIKDELILEINQLHSLRGRRWNLLNSAHISLLPKGMGVCKVKDYRPVSLMHSVAKIVSKMMANRLAPCLHTMIPHSQSAFIKTRSIHDNFLYVKNAVKDL